MEVRGLFQATADLLPEKAAVTNEQKITWAPESICTLWIRLEKNLTMPEFEPLLLCRSDIRLVTLSNWSIAVWSIALQRLVFTDKQFYDIWK